MSKKKSGRPHGHYCKICGEYKANEKFFGRGHATHISKLLSRRNVRFSLKKRNCTTSNHKAVQLLNLSMGC